MVSKTLSFTFLMTFSIVPSKSKVPVFIITILSAMVSISETICDDKITIASFAKSAIKFLKRTRSSGSKPTVGSSKMITFGLFNKACAMPTRCFIPPE